MRMSEIDADNESLRQGIAYYTNLNYLIFPVILNICAVAIVFIIRTAPNNVVLGTQEEKIIFIVLCAAFALLSWCIDFTGVVASAIISIISFFVLF